MGWMNWIYVLVRKFTRKLFTSMTLLIGWDTMGRQVERNIPEPHPKRASSPSGRSCSQVPRWFASSFPIFLHPKMWLVASNQQKQTTADILQSSHFRNVLWWSLISSKHEGVGMNRKEQIICFVNSQNYKVVLAWVKDASALSRNFTTRVLHISGAKL